jgi:hypothetical protein
VRLSRGSITVPQAMVVRRTNMIRVNFRFIVTTPLYRFGVATQSTWT